MGVGRYTNVGLEKITALKKLLLLFILGLSLVTVNAQERIGFYHFEGKNPFQRINQFSIPIEKELLFIPSPTTVANQRKSIDMMREFHIKERKKAFVAQAHEKQLSRHQQNLQKNPTSKEGKIQFRAQPTHLGDGFYPQNSLGNPNQNFGNSYRSYGNSLINNNFYPYSLTTMQRGNIYAW